MAGVLVGLILASFIVLLLPELMSERIRKNSCKCGGNCKCKKSKTE
jgi:hypothetical protein